MKGRGNDGPWTRRKTKNRFPSAPTALGNRRADFHIPTAATKQWKSGKPKPGFPLSPCNVSLIERTKTKTKKGGLAAELRSSSRLTVRLEYATVAVRLGVEMCFRTATVRERLLLSLPLVGRRPIGTPLKTRGPGTARSVRRRKS